MSQGRSVSGTTFTIGTDVKTATVGLQMSVPLYSGGAAAARQREVAALLMKAETELEGVRMLAYSDSTRSEAVPNVPTVAEQGYKGFEVVFAYAMLVHAATPRPIVDALHEASTRAVMSPEVRDKLRGVDTVPIALSPADSAAWLRSYREKWRGVITQMNSG